MNPMTIAGLIITAIGLPCNLLESYHQMDCKDL